MYSDDFGREAEKKIASLTAERDRALTRISHLEVDAEQYAFVSEQEKKELRAERDWLRAMNGEILAALKIADKYLLRDGDREIIQGAIAKAEHQT